MPGCFVVRCSHRFGRDTCSFFRFPKAAKTFKQWKKVCRRQDSDPRPQSRLCSCHFVDGKKENGPSVFDWNKDKIFNFPPAEKRKSRIPGSEPRSVAGRWTTKAATPDRLVVKSEVKSEGEEEAEVKSIPSKPSLKTPAEVKLLPSKPSPMTPAEVKSLPSKPSPMTPAEVKSLPLKPPLTNWHIMNDQHSYCKTQASPSRARSPAMEMVIMTDRRREAYVPSKMLRAEAEPVRPASPAPPLVDPVAEALQLIQADMSAQATAERPQKRPAFTIKLNSTINRETPGDTSYRETPPTRDRYRQRSPSPPSEPVGASIFQDDIEDYCLRVRRGGHGGTVTERFGELLQRQTVVQQLQRRIKLQTAEMRADARQQEEEADAERRKRFRGGEEPSSPPPPPVPPTTAAETLLVLREQGGCCGAADLCLTPHELPRAQALVHRLRCEVLELRACSLRATYEKNLVAAQLNSERAQLRRTFTQAQLARLTGTKVKGRWDSEDVRRAIAARRVLSRRQYRYITEVMRVPLPSLKLRDMAIKTSAETKRLYEQLVAEKVLKHKTKKRRVIRPVRPAQAAAAHPDGLISVASAFSESEDEQNADEKSAYAW